MNNQNQMMEVRKDNELEKLGAEQQGWIVQMAAEAHRVSDLMEPLRKAGIEVSLSTLRRFLRRRQEARVIEDGNELREGATVLAGRGGGEVLRKGALEAVRQKLYEQALLSQSPEGARALYAALLREEEKLKGLELAEQRMALEREKLELQRERLKAEAGRKKVEVESAQVVEGATPLALGAAPLALGAAPLALAAPGAVEEEEEEEEEWKECVMAIIMMVEAILNRMKSPEEQVFAIRKALANQRRLLQREL